MTDHCKGESKMIARIVFRMGLSYGNIIADKEDIYSNDVNVAARLQTVAPAGGIAMTERGRGVVGWSHSPAGAGGFGLPKTSGICAFQCGSFSVAFSGEFRFMKIKSKPIRFEALLTLN